MFVPLGARAATSRMCSTVSAGTGVGRNRRMERREVMAWSTSVMGVLGTSASRSLPLGDSSIAEEAIEEPDRLRQGVWTRRTDGCLGSGLRAISGLRSVSGITMRHLIKASFAVLLLASPALADTITVKMAKATQNGPGIAVGTVTIADTDK